MGRTCGYCIHADSIKMYSNDGKTRTDCWKTGELVDEEHTCDGWGPAPRNGLRPVEYWHIEHVPKTNEKFTLYEDVRVANGYAWFHTWSIESEELNEGVMHYPVAVLELEDGTVINWVSNHIQFLDMEVHHDKQQCRYW